MKRFIRLLYGFAAYLVAMGNILYAIGFTGNFIVPKTIDIGGEAPWSEALVIDLVLLGVFAVQHSVMARRGFKRWWTGYVPQPIERSTYVLFASAALMLLFWLWRPMPAMVWSVDNPGLRQVLQALFWAGWILVPASSFLINHFELFGLQQVVNHLRGKQTGEPDFRTPGLYRIVRHPIYLGFIVAFWSAPDMTVGHLVFAAASSAYILVGIALEERDLVHRFGDRYLQYRREVRALLPWPRRSSPDAVLLGEKAE